jgi:hypothetical protein
METHDDPQTLEIARSLDSLPKVPGVKTMQPHNAARPQKRKYRGSDAANVALIAAATFIVIGWGAFIAQPKPKQTKAPHTESVEETTASLPTFATITRPHNPQKHLHPKTWAVLPQKVIPHPNTALRKTEPSVLSIPKAQAQLKARTESWKNPLILYESGPLTRSLTEIRSKIWPTTPEQSSTQH